jgi:hypothetical protein
MSLKRMYISQKIEIDSDILGLPAKFVLVVEMGKVLSIKKVRNPS